MRHERASLTTEALSQLGDQGLELSVLLLALLAPGHRAGPGTAILFLDVNEKKNVTCQGLLFWMWETENGQVVFY